MAISSGLLTSGIQANSGWDAATSENLENIVEICRAPAGQPEKASQRNGGKGQGGEKRDRGDRRRRPAGNKAGAGSARAYLGLVLLEAGAVALAQRVLDDRIDVDRGVQPVPPLLQRVEKLRVVESGAGLGAAAELGRGSELGVLRPLALQMLAPLRELPAAGSLEPKREPREQGREREREQGGRGRRTWR